MWQHSCADQVCSTATPSHAEEWNAKCREARKTMPGRKPRASKGDIWSEPCPLLLVLSPAPRKEELSSLGKNMKETSMLCNLSFEPGIRKVNQAILGEQRKEGSTLLSYNSISCVFSARQLKQMLLQGCFAFPERFPWPRLCVFGSDEHLCSHNLVNSSVKFVSLFLINNPPTNVSRCQSWHDLTKETLESTGGWVVTFSQHTSLTNSLTHRVKNKLYCAEPCVLMGDCWISSK